MVLLVAILGYLLLSAGVVVSVCVLSARMSRHEDWDEIPLIDRREELNVVQEYQADIA